MDRTAIEAMNKGWALGFSTRVRAVDADFEAARARGAQVEPAPARPRLFEWASLLAAMGPMPRPRH